MIWLFFARHSEPSNTAVTPKIACSPCREGKGKVMAQLSTGDTGTLVREPLPLPGSQS